jgi:hypothetical protein
VKALTVNITCYLLFVITILFSNSIPAQNVSKFKYIYPQPNSSYVSINSSILIRQGSKIERSGVNGSIIKAVGSISGVHTGKIILANDSRTLVFTPAAPFQTNEDITVTLKSGLKTVDGLDAGELSYRFHTCSNANSAVTDKSTVKAKTTGITPKRSVLSVPDSALPYDLPQVIITTSNNPSPGYFFLTPSPYIEIVDNAGTPVFYQNENGELYDFDFQPDGELTYFDYPVNCYGLDSSGNQVRSFNTADGFTVDVHDLRVMPDGSYYIFGKRNVYINMDSIVSGGNPDADIIDGALQQFDSQGNLEFQWDAIQNYNITDVDTNIDLTQQTIDFSHFNSVDIDTDGNLLISARNLDEITKVDHNTGKIIWRLGGKNNQFTFINDNIGFSRQHDIRRLSNGDISLFDNGVYHPIPVSSAISYKLDEINKTATLVYRISHDAIYTDTEGSVQQMANGNLVIGWGQIWYPYPMLTEVTPNDSIAFDMTSEVDYNNYRALKYQWKTNLFTTNTDSINFGNFLTGTPVTKQFTIYNPHSTSVTINEFYCSNSAFSTTITVPVTIKPNDSLVVPVIFTPAQDSSFSVSFNVRCFGMVNGSQDMIARQVILSVSAESLASVKNNVQPEQYQLYQNYPNPFNPGTIINYQIPISGIVTLKVYDVLGREIKTLVNGFKSRGNYSVNFNAGSLSSGVYFYQLKSGGYSSIKKMVLLK